jgi:hypothetical protein
VDDFLQMVDECYDFQALTICLSTPHIRRYGWLATQSWCCPVRVGMGVGKQEVLSFPMQAHDT